MNTEQRREYVKQVCLALWHKEPEDCFSREMTLADFGILQSWMDRKIPLAHVLQAIKESGKRPSIRYLKPAVEAEHERASRRM